nr:AAA family ATPase [Psychrobacter sanguinis]
MTNNYKYVLSIFYLEPNHKATCKYLAEKYHTSSNSLTSLIMNFSKAVISELNRFYFVDEHGNSKYWPVTMIGKNVTGGLFEWQLRNELVEAIDELDFINKAALNIGNLGELIELINQDIGDFKKEFLTVRKEMVGNKRLTNLSVLFKYDNESRNWAINEGGGTEIQYHISLENNVISYGLGFNSESVPRKDEKSPIDYIKPFIKAFVAIADRDDISRLRDKGFELDIDIKDLEHVGNGEYHLFGRKVNITDNKLPLIDYYSILNDLKGDLFKAYKQIFNLANEISNSEKPYEQGMDMTDKNSLMQEVGYLLLANKNLVLTGAPGTGKTYLAKQLAKSWNAEFELIQFHPSYDYTDFVEGLRPIQDENGQVGFELRDGSFKVFCKRALKYQTNQQLSNFDDVYKKLIEDISEEPLELKTRVKNNLFTIDVNTNGSLVARAKTKVQAPMTLSKEMIQIYLEAGKAMNWKPYLIPLCDYITENYDLRMANTSDENKKFIIILDEINRAEISKVFGELFFSIDPGYRGKDGKVTTQYANLQTEEDAFKDGFFIPDNVYIIGTMNDIDRSVETFDFAMRRRFAWKEIKAIDTLTMWEGYIDSWKDEAEQRLIALNTAIESVQGLNSAYHVGPAYFLKLTNYNGDFDKLWTYHLESLLFEYLRGCPDAEEQLLNLKDAYNLQLRLDDARNDR